VLIEVDQGVQQLEFVGDEGHVDGVSQNGGLIVV
jgi:hypothetical protein